MSCSNASIPPLQIRVHDLSSLDITNLHRWIDVDMGEPPQKRFFKLSLLDDTLSIAYPGSCANSPDDPHCPLSYGGLFDSNASTTYRQVLQSQWNGSHSSNVREPVLWFNERVRIGGQILNEYPMVQHHPGGKGHTDYSNVLGLSYTSQFPSRIEALGLAPSTSWGLWIGNADSDGNLIIGGYDEARSSGRFSPFEAFGKTNQYLDQMEILKSIEYQAPNGSSRILLTNVDGEPIALSPERIDLQFKPSLFETFLDALGPTYYPTISQWGWPAGEQLGDFNFEFINGFKMTLAARDLWQPYISYNSTENISNGSIIVSRVVNHTSGGTPSFGVPFFTSVYIKFHPENRFFELAAANTAADVTSSIRSFCDLSTTTLPTTSNPTPSSILAGSIAGGVVGGVAGLILMFLLAWMVLRRRQKSSHAVALELPVPESTEPSMGAHEVSDNSKFEMPNAPKFELPG